MVMILITDVMLKRVVSLRSFTDFNFYVSCLFLWFMSCCSLQYLLCCIIQLLMVAHFDKFSYLQFAVVMCLSASFVF